MAHPASTPAPATESEGLLRHYAGDWRSILEGTAAGVLQLMYPPLGTAVEVRERFGLAWSRGDARWDRFTTAVVRIRFWMLPERVNRASFAWGLRWLGARTRAGRFRP